MNPRKPIVVTLAMLFASLAVAEDFTTVSGRIYKDATVSHVEADGIVLRTKTGISKVYFVELPKDVQQRFHYGAGSPAAKVVTQRVTNGVNNPQSADHSTSFVPDGTTFADKFAQRVEKKLDEREAILQGKHTPGPAELAMIREFNFHWVYLGVIAIVAGVLFTTVWRRFR